MGAQRREKGWLEGGTNSFRGFESRPAFRLRSLEICLRDRIALYEGFSLFQREGAQSQSIIGSRSERAIWRSPPNIFAMLSFERQDNWRIDGAANCRTKCPQRIRNR